MNQATYEFDIFISSKDVMDKPVHIPSFIRRMKQEQVPASAYLSAICEVRQKLKYSGISKKEIDSLGFEPRFVGFECDERDHNNFYFTGFRFIITISGSHSIISRIR